MSKLVCRDVKVLEVVPVGQSERTIEFFELHLEHPGWSEWKPGQFVMIRPSAWDLEIIWARPFSISSVTSNSLVLFIQVVGRGTSRLANLSPGQNVALWGPAGNGFAVEPDTRTLLMAGGMGIAPFRGYLENHPSPGNVRLFFAHRMPLECYPYHEIAGMAHCEHLMEKTPDDLQAIISRMGDLVSEYADGGLILSCGPTPFMRTVASVANQTGARAQVSLENRMACGVGACLGCVVENSRGDNVRTCANGPVFWTKDISF